MYKKAFIIISAGLILFSCKSQKTEQENVALRKQVKTLKQTIQIVKESNKRIQFLNDQLKGVKARIITNYGNIELSFRPDKAPLHCFNFITRAESGYYNHTLFHRVIPGFMIQGGDPNTKTKNVQSYGQGGPLVHIPHEFNDLKHERGVLSMARVSDVSQGAGSQFFITQAATPQLDGQYTVFGKVTSGMDVVDKIANVKRNNRDLPLKPVQIKTIEVFR